jgi:hypothetical protein
MWHRMHSGGCSAYRERDERVADVTNYAHYPHEMHLVRTFGISAALALIGLALGGLYGGGTGLLLVAVLALLELSLSFDNAVVNASVLGRVSPFWQKMFLTLGVAIAVFGMRLLFPLLIVGITAKLNPIDAVQLALDKGDVDTPGTYGYLLHDAHPAIAAFGGIFLLMLFLDFIVADHEITWLTWIERPLKRIGRLNQLPTVIALGTVLLCAYTLAPPHKISTVLGAGVFGLLMFLAIKALSELFGSADNVLAVVGRAAFVLFLYLEILDASFSFDGVVGAFAITSDPILILIGLGIGAMFIRSITIFLVRRGSLANYAYLEHGAMWAVGALAVLLLVSIGHDVPEGITGLIGIVFILAAFASSIVRNRRAAARSASKCSARGGGEFGAGPGRIPNPADAGGL